MTARPIIFSGPMVRALLEGRKTQTRRVLKPQPPRFSVEYEERWRVKAIPSGRHEGKPREWTWWEGPPHGQSLYHKADVPYATGDSLWVREAWAAPALMDIQYRADPPTRHGHWDGSRGPWRPSIHMPRWASRLTLRVTGVKVERLQDISEEDAWAEGVDETDFYDNAERKVSAGAPWAPERLAFADLWNSLHGPGSWEDNPWVAAISFEIIRANVDQVKP